MTKTEALNKVFETKGLNGTLRYRKHLFQLGQLSELKATETLKEFGYIKVKEEIWKRNSK